MYHKEDFVPNSSPVNSPASFSHKMAMGTFHGDPASINWYRKEADNPADARRELLAQEFFRVLIPHQPRTRLRIHPTLNTAYVFSEEVISFEPFVGEGPCYGYGDYPGNGLGQALMASVFLQETDLKNGNIGLDKDQRVIKIDGDWSLSALAEGKRRDGSEMFPIRQFQITKELLDGLPYPTGYPAHNWLQHRKNGRSIETGFTNGLEQNLDLKREVYETIQKVMLTPDGFICGLADACFPAGAKRYSDFLIKRKKELTAVAITMPQFMKYLDTKQAKRVELQHHKHLESFNVGGEVAVLRIASDDEKSFKSGYGSKLKSELARGRAFRISVEAINLALNAYEPSFRFGLFRQQISLGSKKESAKRQALELLANSDDISYEKQYQQLYDILFKPFSKKDILQGLRGNDPKFLAVLKQFKYADERSDNYPTYSQAHELAIKENPGLAYSCGALCNGE